MATRRRPNSNASYNQPPENDGSVIYGYGDLPTTIAPAKPAEEESVKLPIEEPVSKSSHQQHRATQHKKGKPYRSRFRVGMTLLSINLAVILVFWLLHRPQRDLHKIPGVVSFLEHAHRMLGDEYVVLITASTTHAGGTYVRVGRSNITALDALHQATHQLPVHRIFKWFKVDYINGLQRLENFNYDKQFSEQFGQWYGLSLGWDSGAVFLPDQVRAHSLVDRQGYLRWERLVLWMHKHNPNAILSMVPDYADDASYLEQIDLFHTDAIFVDMADHHHHSTAPVVALDHGHQIFHNANAQELRQVALDAAKYLMRDSAEGHMVSFYQPRSHYLEYSSSSSELWHGHSHSMYAMAQVYAIWADSKLQETMSSGFKYYVESKHLQHCRLANGDHQLEGMCLVEKEGSSRLANNAMLLLAMAEYAETTRGVDTDFDTMKKIANYIEASFLDGNTADELFVQKILYQSGEVRLDKTFTENDAESLTAFALARVVNLFEKKRGFRYRSEWKEIAHKAVETLVTTQMELYSNSTRDFVPDPLLLQGIAQIYKMHLHTAAMTKYAEQAALFTTKYQIQTKTTDPKQRGDLYGSFLHDSSGTASAELSNGLCNIYPLLPRDQKNLLKRSLLLSAKFQLQFQFRPENALYMKDPQRILGGMHEAHDSLDMSNYDSSQNILSLLCIAKVISGETT